MEEDKAHDVAICDLVSKRRTAFCLSDWMRDEKEERKKREGRARATARGKLEESRGGLEISPIQEIAMQSIAVKRPSLSDQVARVGDRPRQKLFLHGLGSPVFSMASLSDQH
ncbi:hypothetical protein L195_g017561 [Trifolium pratense]|uniref:Uncharacterized protein n=1 Tax=Trifolium pratense TaxID=57577 RepID=A0A2K3MUF4_TRIPR|nr:hypothetical protein L195_g017561 [Trifolium pratense]